MAEKEKTRYSDEELQEFRVIIEQKLAEAKTDLGLLQEQIDHRSDNSDSDTAHKFNMMDDGSEVLSREKTAQLASRQMKFIKHLEAAMVRIENKTYGICRETGKLIAKERLKIVPHATLSIDAKKKKDMG